jgi:hypothetical protein
MLPCKVVCATFNLNVTQPNFLKPHWGTNWRSGDEKTNDTGNAPILIPT